MVVGVLTRNRLSLFSARVIAASLSGSRAFEHVDLARRRKESAAPKLRYLSQHTDPRQRSRRLLDIEIHADNEGLRDFFAMVRDAAEGWDGSDPLRPVES
jgi:hypothetical protein